MTWVKQMPATDSTIEGLRGLAALLVVATHYVPLVREQAGLWGLASTGVDLFFVLSGFVFAPYFGRPGFHFGEHMMRRVFRIYPLYIVALLVYALLKPEAQRWDALASHLTMAHTLGSVQTAAFYNVAFWSLPPEVEFYLLLPLLCGLAGRMGTGGLLAAALLAKMLLVFTAYPGEALDSARSIATIHLPGLLVEFMMGVAAAKWLQQRKEGDASPSSSVQESSTEPQRTEPVTTLLLIAAMLGAGLCLAYQLELADAQAQSQAPLWLRGIVGLWAAAAYAFLVAGLVALGRRAAEAARAAPWMPWAVWAGRLSFGVYLLHNAAPQALQRVWPDLQGWPLLVGSLLLTLLLALVLHLLVEDPCREFGRRLGKTLGRSQGRAVS